MQEQVYEEMNELEGKHWWFCARRRYIETIIKRFIPHKTSDLEFCEIGSGTGGNLSLLTKFAVVDAVEMNDGARELIADKKVAGVRNIYPGHLPDNMTHSKEYDAIFCLDVIEHVEQDSKAIVRLKEYLKNDAYIITTVPAYQWLWSPHDVANHHIRRYTKKEYLKLFTESGFDVVYSSYFNTLLFPVAVLSRMFDLLKSKLSDQLAVLKMPPGIVNSLFKWLFSVESLWAGRLSMPFGLSIVVVAKRRQ